MNVFTNVLYCIDPKELVKGHYMGVSKSFKKAAETVLNVWRFEGTTMIEKNTVIIEERKK